MAENFELKKVIVEQIGNLIPWVLSLFSVWFGYFLSRKSSKDQSNLETRKSTYAKLLFTSMSEEDYPNIAGSADSYSDLKIADHNKKLNEWRKNRKSIKGLVAEALFVTQNKKLSDRLSNFISSNDPDEKLLFDDELKNLMKKEIGM